MCCPTTALWDGRALVSGAADLRRAAQSPCQHGGCDTRGTETCHVQDKGREKGGLVCFPPARLF